MNLDLLQIELKLRSLDNELLTNYRTTFRYNEKIEGADLIVLDLIDHEENDRILIEYFYKGQKLDKRKMTYNYFSLFKLEYEQTSFIIWDVLVFVEKAELNYFGKPRDQPESILNSTKTLELPFLIKPDSSVSQNKENRQNSQISVEIAILHFLNRNYQNLFRFNSDFLKNLKILQSNSLNLENSSQIDLKMLQLDLAISRSVEQLTHYQRVSKIMSFYLPSLTSIISANLIVFEKYQGKSKLNMTVFEKSIDEFPDALHHTPLFASLLYLKIKCCLNSQSFEKVLKLCKMLRKIIPFNKFPPVLFFQSESYFFASQASFFLYKFEKAQKYLRLAIKTRVKIEDEHSQGCAKYFELYPWISISLLSTQTVFPNYETMIRQQIVNFQSHFNLEFFVFWTNFRSCQIKLNLGNKSEWIEIEDKILESLSDFYEQVNLVKSFFPQMFGRISQSLLTVIFQKINRILLLSFKDDLSILLKKAEFIFESQFTFDFKLTMLKIDYKILKIFVLGKNSRSSLLKLLRSTLKFSQENFGEQNYWTEKIKKNLKVCQK